MKRPLARVLLCYLAGILLGDVIPLPVQCWLSLGCVLAAGCIGSARLRTGLLPGLLLVAGGANLTLNQQIISPVDLRCLVGASPVLARVQGVVSRVDLRSVTNRLGEAGLRTNARLQVEAVQIGEHPWRAASGQVLATTRTDAPSPLRTGQHVRLFGVCRLPPAAFLGGMFDYRRHLARRGIYRELLFEGESDVVLLEDPPAPLSDRFRTWALNTLQRGLPDHDEAVGLIAAMTLGWRTSLEDGTARPFMRSGTMHLFAISGLHIGLVGGILMALLRIARLRREWLGVVVVPGLWFFTTMTGWQPSAVRATIMMSVVLLGWSLRRPVDLLNTLSAAALLILLWDPRQLFHAGFQLSFAVVVSIALILPPLERIRRRLLRTDPFLPAELRPRWQQRLDGPLRFVTMSVAVSVAAWLGSLPLIMHYFHLITPVGLIANVVIVQLGALTLAAASGSLLSAALLPPVSVLFNHSAWFFARAMIASSQWFSSLPLASVNAKSPPLVVMICYYSVLWLVVSGWLLRHRTAGCPLAAALAILAAVAWHRDFGNPRLAVLPLSGGHAVFLENPGAENWLIDCGDDWNWRFRVRPFLESRGINRIDNLVLTHGDSRQVGAATNVIEGFHPRRVVLNPVAQRSRSYPTAVELVARRRLEVIQPEAGESLPPWRVLHPAVGDPSSRADSTSLTLLLELNGRRVLHLPDLDATGLDRLLKRHSRLQADVIVASPVSGGNALAGALATWPRARNLVIAEGEFPAGERLSPEVRKRLRLLGGESWFTSESGAIELVFSRRGATDIRTAPQD